MIRFDSSRVHGHARRPAQLLTLCKLLFLHVQSSLVYITCITTVHLSVYAFCNREVCRIHVCTCIVLECFSMFTLIYFCLWLNRHAYARILVPRSRSRSSIRIICCTSKLCVLSKSKARISCKFSSMYSIHTFHVNITKTNSFGTCLVQIPRRHHSSDDLCTNSKFLS